jgi:DNA-binding cell septation regulator SpoVG
MAITQGRCEKMSEKMRLLGWRRLPKGSLLGFAEIELPIGLVIREIPVLRGPEGPWAALPGKPELDRDNRTVRLGPDGRPLYRELMVWRSRRLREAFSERVVALVRAAYPDDLTE